MQHAAEIRRATIIGATAILMWATLAALVTQAQGVPPLQIVAMSFAVAAGIGIAWPLARGRAPWAALRQRPAVWLLGIGGLFGYHFVYILALQLAPPVPTSLLNYLWPLLIVVFSGLLPGEHLRLHHVGGALAGLAGAVLLIVGDKGLDLSSEHALGYGAAVLAALLWSGYSVLSRRFGSVPTEAVGGFCAATAILALLCHLAFETTVTPDLPALAAILALGIGPMGAAFFVWDYGLKRGDIKALGASAYATPLLSTLLLIAFGLGEPSWRVAAACLLIVGGALLATKDVLFRKN